MKRVFKYIFYIIGCLILLILGFILLVYFTSEKIYLTEEIHTSDRAYHARVQKLNSPFLDRYTTDVIITNKEHSIIERLKGDYSAGVLILRGDPKIKINWINNRTLKVNYSDCDGNYGQTEKWNDIIIIFEGKCN